MEVLTCMQCSIEYLKNLPPNLNLLSCYNNNVVELNSLPENLLSLDCSRNKIKNLDSLPEKLIKLKCSYNLITHLQNLPKTLTNLDCSHNNLIELNSLPESLVKLICDSNYISNINLPNGIEYIDARNNCLNSIPKINKYLYLANYSLSEESAISDKIKSVENKIIWYSSKSAKFISQILMSSIMCSMMLPLAPIIIPLAIHEHYKEKNKCLNI